MLSFRLFAKLVKIFLVSPDSIADCISLSNVPSDKLCSLVAKCLNDSI